PENRGINKLPKQATPPTAKQLQAMFQETMNGRTSQVGFGDPPEEYSLAVFKDRQKNEIHWALYRGEGDGAMMLWDQSSHDPAYIHQLITAQFPGWDLKPVALRPTEELPLPQSYPTHHQGELPAPVHSPPVQSPQSIGGHMGAKPTFEGDLRNLQMPNVLQSIGMSKSTGRMEIENASESAVIFFAEGMPIHCISRGMEGESSFLELVGWEEGAFRFYPGVMHEKKTIKRRLDTLLMEGAALDDQFQALRKLGAHTGAFISRKNFDLTEQEFDSRLESGTGADVDLCKLIYQQIGSRSRWVDLVRKLNLTKPQWVPVLFNLASCNLIYFSDQIAEAPANFVAEVNIDWTQIAGLERTIIRPDTEIMSYPAFLYFARMEQMRWERFGHPFAIVLLQMSARAFDSGAAEPLSLI
ncbi:MAG: DUF4388 domain-containing protein, partial [Cyanobacteria bacterium SZAS LIN-2]|nr:DUF4388 domain-containing protein [Cyanobacteria bacterium SZAS LIN-2]